MADKNIYIQGMLKILQDLHIMLKAGKQQPLISICDNVGIDKKYMDTLLKGKIVINISSGKNPPVYKWNSIEPNIYMVHKLIDETPELKINNETEFEKANRLHKEGFSYREISLKIFNSETYKSTIYRWIKNKDKYLQKNKKQHKYIYNEGELLLNLKQKGFKILKPEIYYKEI